MPEIAKVSAGPAPLSLTVTVPVSVAPTVSAAAGVKDSTMVQEVPGDRLVVEVQLPIPVGPKSALVELVSGEPKVRFPVELAALATVTALHVELAPFDVAGHVEGVEDSTEVTPATVPVRAMSVSGLAPLSEMARVA